MSNSEKGIWAWSLVKLFVGGSLLLFALTFMFQGWNEEAVRASIRWSARISGSLFCLAFGASAFHAWQKNSFSWWVFMNRKFFGISFAIVHLVHLFFLILLQLYFYPLFTEDSDSLIVVGILAYVFIVLMLLTSFPFFSKFLTKKNWKILHTTGGYWIWVVFMNSFWGRAIHQPEYLPIAILLVLVFGLRIWKLRFSRT